MPRSVQKLTQALDDTAAGLEEFHPYLDIAEFDEHLAKLETLVNQAETAKGEDTCRECGELIEDCVCDDEEDEETSEDV